MAEQLAGFQFAKPFDVTNPVSTDKRYGKFNGSTTIPFTNIAEALDLIKPALRYQGLQCVIVNGASIGLYWWRDGVADEQLVLLQTDVDLSGKADKAYVDSQVSSERTERQLADANLIAGIASGDTATLNAAKIYTDTQVAAIYRTAGDWDISINSSYPTLGTGTNGGIRRGDAYNITGGGSIGINYYQPGDTIYAKIANPGQVEANWGSFDTNQQQATEAMRGIAKIATQATIESETTIEDQTMVTPKKFWQGIARTLGISRIVSGLWTFLDGMRFGSLGFYATFTKSLTSNSLTLKNNVFQSGAIGKAISFTNSNHYAVAPFNNIPQNNSPFSVSIWYNPTYGITGGAGVNLVSWGDTGSNLNGVNIRTIANKIMVSKGNTVIASPAANSESVGWKNLVVTFDGSNARIYLNTILIYTIGITFSSTPSSMQFGRNGSGGAGYLGLIDQVLIYNYALPQSGNESVNKIYNSGFGTASPPNIGLLRRWEFDEGNGASSIDLTGNGNFTLYNTVIWSNNGKVPTGGTASEATVFNSIDGITNGERGQQTFGDAAGGNIQQGKAFRVLINGSYPLWVDNFGKILINPLFDGFIDGLGSVSSAYLELAAGKATMGDSALKFRPGLLLNTIENGAWEYDGTNLYFSTNGNRIKINANLQSMTDQGNITTNDLEIITTGKGLILKDEVDGTRRRLTISNGTINLSQAL
ncbi:LamG-like jellyroll fold domain-containing protein [Mucilaginibacter terrae]|uniref:LamG-like jellyroll fold domain-containing protein n=1 Tax=Mucilaginibacter terrae TaxID=1955052 RepID=UPI003645A6CC